MPIDRKIADVCSVALEEISFFDLFTSIFSRFSAIQPASPILRPCFPDLTSPRPHVPNLTSLIPDLASLRPRFHVPTRILSRVPTHPRVPRSQTRVSAFPYPRPRPTFSHSRGELRPPEISYFLESWVWCL